MLAMSIISQEQEVLYVIRSRGIITAAHWTPCSDKDAPSVLNHIHDFAGLAGVKDKMLWGVVICEFHSFVERVELDYVAICQSFDDDISTRE
jgi:hypothetical protein